MPRPPKNGLILNDRTVRSLRPAVGRLDYMDLTLKGFGIMVRPTGTKTFFVRYRTPRGFRRLMLGNYPGTTLADARKAAKGAIGGVAKGGDPQEARHARLAGSTFGELASHYLEVHAKRRKRSWQEDERMLERDLLPAWRNVLAAEIRRRDVAQVLDRIVGRGSPIMANRVRALASKIFNFGLAREVVEFNPVAGLPPASVERSRDRVLNEAEVRALWGIWEAESSVTSAAFRMLLLTAQREMEVLTMRWEEIEGDWWRVPAGVVKNKLGHRVFLSDLAVGLLQDLRESTGCKEWVFASPRLDGHITSLNTAKQRFRTLSGIHDWHPHDLRRTAATYMGRMGVSRAAIAKVLNHAEPGVTAIYDRSTGEAEVAHALRLWGQRLAELLSGREPADNVIKFG